MTIGGLPGNPVTNADDMYSAAVDYGFSGTATPSIAGYTFSPATRGTATSSRIDQSNLHQHGQDLHDRRYGRRRRTALSGVTIGGLPGSPVTNASGDYSATVSYGFSGTATPSKAGYTFSPATRTYSNVTANQTSQTYTGTRKTFTISGRVTDSGGTARLAV